MPQISQYARGRTLFLAQLCDKLDKFLTGKTYSDVARSPRKSSDVGSAWTAVESCDEDARLTFWLQ
jgi:hypothetical protein